MGKNFVEINENLPDDEIIRLINNGDYELLQIIIRRYHSVVAYYVNKYCPLSQKEDAYQEATFALYSAVKTYDSNKSSFSTFANLCIKRSVIGLLRNSKHSKNIPDELLSSIDDIDIADTNSPEKIFFDNEDFKTLKANIKLELSGLEYRVLQLYLEGNKYTDIAKSLEISEKSVNNSLTRIRKKLKR